MKKIGQILKSARIRKKYSLKKVEDLTKIKSNFIDAIENERWEVLPPFPTVLGFVKSVSTTLNINEKTAVAVLKRDYPPKLEPVSPKPDILLKFVWSPKLTFAVGTIIVLAAILGYLVFQYFRFISSPKLVVDKPKEGQMVIEDFVTVSGNTDTDAKITVNNQPVITDQDGKFSATLEVNAETKEVVIKSISRSGKETMVKRRITVEKR